MSTAKIRDKGQVTIPTSIRRQAGLSQGDVVEFGVRGGKIVITPKIVIDRSNFPTASDEYTPAQRRVIDSGINQSLKEYRQGKVAGPFETAEAFLADLRKQSARLGAKKAKRAAK